MSRSPYLLLQLGASGAVAVLRAALFIRPSVIAPKSPA